MEDERIGVLLIFGHCSGDWEHGVCAGLNGQYHVAYTSVTPYDVFGDIFDDFGFYVGSTSYLLTSYDQNLDLLISTLKIGLWLLNEFTSWIHLPASIGAVPFYSYLYIGHINIQISSLRLRM